MSLKSSKEEPISSNNDQDSCSPRHCDDDDASSSSSRRDPGLQYTAVVSHPSRDPLPPQGLAMSRAQQVKRLRQATCCNVDSTTATQKAVPFDVLVIGLGATGAGVAWDAATRGNLTVAAIDRGDFGSETSTRSTKLLWAGLKYLGTAVAQVFTAKNWVHHPIQTVQTFISEVQMVWHCHKERQYMLEQQGHLCYWLPIIVPFQTWPLDLRTDRPPPLGNPLFCIFPVTSPLVLKVYDAFSGFTCPPTQVLSPHDTATRQRLPCLDWPNLAAATLFYEGHHNDARTNVAIAMSAAQAGAVVANYVEMVDVLVQDDSQTVGGVVAVDRVTNQTFSIRAKQVVFCGGPFTNQLLYKQKSSQGGPVQTAWGTHIVVSQDTLPVNQTAWLDYNTRDGRFLFIAPWLGHTLIGTTDQKDNVGASTWAGAPEQDIEWLLQEVQTYVKPNVRLQRSDVLSAWRGWRPLVVASAGDSGGGPVSRDHVIAKAPADSDAPGAWFVAGGKWTTWREMAQDVVDKIHKGRCRTKELKLWGGVDETTGQTFTTATDLVQRLQQCYPDMEMDVVEHLVATYACHVWQLCQTGQDLSDTFYQDRLVPDYPYLQAEVVYACREYACTVEDVLSRRTRLAFLNKAAAIQAIPTVARIMAQTLGWTEKVQVEQMQAAKVYMESYSGTDPAKVPVETALPLPSTLREGNITESSTSTAILV